MGVTFGDMKGDISLMPCGVAVAIEIVANKINNRMAQVLAAHPWTRLRIDDRITAVAKYVTGTIAIDNGATDFVLTGGTLTADMQDRRIRIAGRAEIYTLSFTDATHGSIDPVYEGDDVTAASIEIFQNIFALNSPMIEIDSIYVPRAQWDLDEISAERLSESVRSLFLFGPPEVYAPAPDTTGFMRQVELYPVPEMAESYPVRGRRGVPPITNDDEQFLPWLPTSCIQAGVEADLLALKGDYTGSDRREASFQKLLMDAIAEDIRRMPNAEMRAANTEHREARHTKGRGRRVINWNAAS